MLNQPLIPVVVDKPSLTFVFGTRPEIIKLSPVIHECTERKISYDLIHTGQHYSEKLDDIFFDQLDLPTPEYNLAVGSKSHGRQTGEMIAGIEEILDETTPDTVLVQGDTNSVLAGAIAASKLPINLGHIEAGLRSYDREMPEETNRVLTDHTSDYLFAPTETSVQNLQNEGLSDELIHLTGNTVVDAVYKHQQLADRQSTLHTDFGIDPDEFILLTVHRAENIDDQSRFKNILDGVSRLGQKLGAPILYPAHPRAKKLVESVSICVPDNIRVVDPLGYLDFLHAESSARLVVTDSGGVQEEACILGTPCITVRHNTERPETVSVGANSIVGTDPNAIIECGLEAVSKPTDWPIPFGNGTAAATIIDICCR
ncbi:UDP-N-acetylglucosamine 2-epimerase (non-hydrolyzing) [Halapricum sp. CBA1109]|uniref:non-hydrolyzing UDP-N-acetylglucosamine 2-epimerase n=1 Tax=Halapricum sp. CBA1109 TaxID=2668068 RepID=UPI0012F996B8|nr:UDP-N-acetylglucosamine 2-epimerase (non-hydrolyzing) [Halapricum sp. CBA1109]MUV88798.1 UDP-N-acetylglucosamine 2-epimerase (non-hydrolyzing) [Halapricum sp. CBA1109]